VTPLPDSPGRRRRGLHAQVVDELGRTIVAGGPRSGVSLVTDDLAEHFGVSRTVIREAFRSLESKGLIGARPNVGTSIRPLREWNLLDPDIIEWRALGPQGDDQRDELRELRGLIETFAVRLAAGTKIRDAWALMTTAALDMDDALRHGQAEAFAQADTRFHHHLVRAADSLLLNHLATIVTHGLTLCAEPTTCENTQASVTHHMAIVGALRQDNEPAAAAAERAVRDLPESAPNTDSDGGTPLPRQRT
jgi:DNA-binding FadR family transcriptional regulator